ncbi:MAG TPA: mechanosensitive ion channel family protein [Polyangiaceae bacterium]|nr:mechanosensitive ion channel family protein [Polyangiaceae bacterium]
MNADPPANISAVAPTPGPTGFADKIFDAVSDQGALSGAGVGVIIALVLLIVARLLLPAEERRLVRLPFFFLVLFGITWTASLFYPAESTVGRLTRLCELFMLLASIGNSLFLIVIRAVLAKRLAFPLPRIVQDILQIGVYVAVALITLRAAGVEPSSLLATSALLTAVIGLSLQDTLGNMFAGLAIQAERPFEVGDWIQYDATQEHIGEVTEINWRATKLITQDRVVITVPNGSLAKSSIRNFSRPESITRRTTIIYAPYDVSPDRVQQALVRAAQEAPGVLAAPPVTVITRGFTDRGMEYGVRFFIDNFRDRDPITSAVNDRLWYAMTRLRVPIPVPRRHIAIEQLSDDVHARVAEQAADRRLRTLEQVDFLQALPRELLAELARSAETRVYAPGEYILHQGETGEEMFIIDSGQVGVVLERKANEQHVAALGHGQCFGEMSVMTGEPRKASIRAISETVVLVVDKSTFKTLLEKNEGVLEDISEILADRHQQLDEAALHEVANERKTQPALLLSRIKSFFSVSPPSEKVP